MRLHLITETVLFVQLVAVASAACYYPNGDIAPNDTPCQDDTDNAVCCGQGYACLSNGICQATGEELQKPYATEFVRGACTDKLFRSSKCPLFCIDPDIDYVEGGMGLKKCANTDKDMYYCINDNKDDVDCENGEGVLYFAGKVGCHKRQLGLMMSLTTFSRAYRNSLCSHYYWGGPNLGHRIINTFHISLCQQHRQLVFRIRGTNSSSHKHRRWGRLPR